MRKEIKKYSPEIQDSIDVIKLLGLEYMQKLVLIIAENGWEINPCEGIKYAYLMSTDQKVKEKAIELRNMLKDLNLYRGFTIFYIDHFTNKAKVKAMK